MSCKWTLNAIFTHCHAQHNLILRHKKHSILSHLTDRLENTHKAIVQMSSTKLHLSQGYYCGWELLPNIMGDPIESQTKECLFQACLLYNSKYTGTFISDTHHEDYSFSYNQNRRLNRTKLISYLISIFCRYLLYFFWFHSHYRAHCAGRYLAVCRTHGCHPSHQCFNPLLQSAIKSVNSFLWI